MSLRYTTDLWARVLCLALVLGTVTYNALAEENIPVMPLIDGGETIGHRPPSFWDEDPFYFPPMGSPSDFTFRDLDNRGGGGGQTSKSTSTNNTAIESCSGATSSGNPKSDNPVILATGEKVQIEHDILASGIRNLSLDRTYRSASTTTNMFGSRWQSTYDYPVLKTYGCVKYSDYPNQCFPTSIVITLPDGATYTYTPAGTDIESYQVNGSSDMGTLTYAPGMNYIVTIGSKTYTYSASNKTIQKVTKEGGEVLLQWTYASGINGRPSQVSNGAGHYINFTYNASALVSTATDQDGNQWSYGYSGLMLTSVTSPGASPDIRTYFYESPYGSDLLTGIAINGVRYSTYSYDSARRVQNVSWASGERNDTFSYGTNSTTLTDVRGQATTYTFLSVQGALKIQSISRATTSTCPGSSATTTYDANGWVSSKTDWNGNVTNYSFDASGKLNWKTSAVGTSSALTQTNTWNGDKLATVTYQDAGGTAYVRVTYDYVTSGPGINNVAAETWDDLLTGAQRRMTYDYSFVGAGLLMSLTVTKTLPSGSAITTYSYDTAGNLTSVTNPLGQQISYSNYNGRGFPRTITDITGVTTTLVWDEKSNLVSSTLNTPTANLATTYVYNHARQPLSITYPDGRATQYQYNASLRPEYIGNAAGEFIHYAINVSANTSTVSSDRKVPGWNGSSLTSSTSGLFSVTRHMDSLGRVISEQGNNSQNTSYTYDNNGNKRTRANTAGRTTYYDYDAADRMVRITNADGGVTGYDYGPTQFVRSVTDPRGVITYFAYNGFGEVTSVGSPDTGTTSYDFDTGGRVTAMYTAKGTTTYGWDQLGRRTYGCMNNECQAFTYDEGTYGKGHLTHFNDPTGQTTYTYDAAGHVTQQASDIYGLQQPTTNWTYDTKGRMSSLTYPNGFSITYNYDAYGRISSITSNLSGTWTTLASSFLYEPATDQRYAWRFGNSLPRMLTLDSDGRLTQVSSPGKHDLSIGYYSTDAISSITDNVYSTLSTSFGYDTVDRLTSASRTSDPQTFQLDVAGNRTSQTRDNATYTFTPANNSNRLVSWSSAGKYRNFTYDDLGNVTSETRDDGSRTYGFNNLNRLNTVNVNGTFVGDYRYNALNQRVLKISNGVYTYYVYGPSGELLAEIGPSTTNYVWLDGRLLGIARNGQFYASHNDQVGRPEVLTDAAGNIVWRAENAAFDRRNVVVDNIGGLNAGFPGQFYDTESGLWYNWNRYYDASIGRYLQSDPVGLGAGTNTYEYVHGNPISRVDASGLDDFGLDFSINSRQNPVRQAWDGGATAIASAVRGPDYAVVSANIYVASGSLAINFHNGNTYVQGGLTRAYPSPSFKPGGSAVLGSILACGVDGDRVDKFLNGGGNNASYFAPLGPNPFIGAGGGISHSYGGDTALEYGLGTPGASVSPVTYGQRR